MQNTLTQIISIYIAGITGLYKGVPVGFALQSSPVLTGLFTALGSVTIVLIIFLSGQSLKKKFEKRMDSSRFQKKQGRFLHIMDKYGVFGLGIIAPGIIGPIVSSILGVMLIKDTGKFLYFLITGIFIWSVVLTTIGYYSIEFITNSFFA